ncbi:MAG: periplasmic heavy metal sensor [Deltaproteobacteria bacterium]|nr:periplasmic heavy metal sensor [Deltaproteobacteria bacterium]MBW1959815.1 periplasmic heavy metal sensor [Deltaproteobacteria bacterium]MBW1992819.1 periplasmic heavy metal sensor [Deltaproteobacteria bacterium]MBW2153131.1 periplasmic heavy metal sensor [Deltaproteobacteria bacterium]
MKKRNILLLTTGLTIIALIAFGFEAFAGWGGMGMYGRGPGYGPGSGYGMMQGYGPGPGYSMMRGYGPRGAARGYCPGYQGYGLSEDEVKDLENQRTAFLKETETLRNQIYQKRLELRSELAKETPNVEKIKKLQAEISELRSQLDQKRMDHILSLKKINPNIGRGFMGRGPRGFYRGHRGW